MNDIQQGMFTVITGVLVLALSQIVIKFLIEPFQKYREMVGEIVVTIIDYGRNDLAVQEYYVQQLELVLELPEPRKSILEDYFRGEITLNYDRSHEAAKVLRRQAGQLSSSANAIPFYKFWVIVQLLPAKNDVEKAASCLIGMANSTHRGSLLTEYKDNITKALRLKIMPG
jgi:hypothetical protein